MSCFSVTTGVSSTAAYIENATRLGRSRLQEAEVFGLDSPLRAELEELWSECQSPNWDGHHALPVSRGSLLHTYQFLESLPLGFRPPSLSADPDGQLTLEWYKSPSRLVSISVDPDGVLHYAGLLGANRRYGTETFYGEIPDEILRLIREILP